MRWGIGACGHQTNERRILIKVLASCQPHQKATSGSYVAQEGIYYNTSAEKIHYHEFKQLSNTQTTYACDFTPPKCLQLKGLTSPCRLPDIPAKCSWNWQDIVDIDNNPGSLIYVVTGTVRDKPAWHYVLVARDQEEKFKSQVATDAVDLSKFGYIIKCGWGIHPPDNVQKDIYKYKPSYL